MNTAIIGGGAAGFFLAIELKRIMPEMNVTIFERGKKALSKVEISGGGRCNCTNSFQQVKDLKQVYPRGANLLKRLFKQFGPKDAYMWFEKHGVPLVTQEDQCVFPEAQDSHAIINCFMQEAHKYGVKIIYNYKVQGDEPRIETHIIENKDGTKVLDNSFLINGTSFNYLVITTGGIGSDIESGPLTSIKQCILTPVPSLFTFSIKDKALQGLMGTVVENAMTAIPGTKFKSDGPLLITHWGMSGPAILKLSSHAARYLNENNYKSVLSINWTGERNTDSIKEYLEELIINNKQKLLTSYRPFNLQQRLWEYLVSKLGKQCKWGELGKKDINKLVDILTNDKYDIAGRYAFKDEFVTCGGVSLDTINKNTMESKDIANMFFAGEVLDIDGITGGFNFQAAWSTAYAAAHGIYSKAQISK
ncbi:MAG: aminoacetone oxidase family FAD-binding enzyme [Bacteroidaceae bacterium]|nr:aminoacetone oxidase family FAD-binding enzyme [Bacteroidaceae bacterium]